MGKQPAQHAPASAHRSDQASTTASAPVVAPAPGQVDALVSSTTATRTPGLAVAPSMDLGDPLIGTRNIHEFTAFNLDPHMQASLQVRFEGHPSIMLTEAPETLWPSIENNPKPIKLWFAPTSDAPAATTAIIRANWQMNARPAEEHRVQITGAGRQAFAPTRQQKVEAAEADKAQQASEQATADARLTLDRRREEFYGQDKHEHGDGALKELEDERVLLQAALTSVASNRKSGIDAAKGLVANYKRVVPAPAEPSILERLAWAAIDEATYGLGSTVVGAFRGAAGDLLMDGAEKAMHAQRKKDKDSPLETPSTAIVGLMADGVGALVSYGIDKGVGAVKSAARDDQTDDHHRGDNGADAVSLFFMQQDKVNWADAAVPAAQFSIDVRNSVVHLLPANRARAVGIMKSATVAFKNASGSAHIAQMEASVAHWMRYVAQSAMGSVTAGKAKQQGVRAMADGSTTTDMRAANQAPDAHHGVQTFDGLVDLRFEIEQGNPLEKATVASVMVRGVNPEAAKVLASKPLFQWKLPVRAVAQPTRSSAVAIPLTVLRDEAGNLSFTDNMHGPADAPSWLSRKAGAVRGSAEKQHEGARILMEQELLAEKVSDNLIKTDGGG